jgi:hypothetical protein
VPEPMLGVGHAGSGTMGVGGSARSQAVCVDPAFDPRLPCKSWEQVPHIAEVHGFASATGGDLAEHRTRAADPQGLARVQPTEHVRDRIRVQWIDPLLGPHPGADVHQPGRRALGEGQVARVEVQCLYTGEGEVPIL